jgi:AP-3 complex subunit mu
MLSAVFLLNKDATILIEKQYRERIPRSEIEPACLAIRDKLRPPPGIIPNGDYTLFLHLQSEIWVVGICEGDEFALFGVSVLQYLGRLLSNLLSDGATESSIKSEYPVVYQILDYAVDGGFPYLNESNTILTLLTRPPTDYAKGNRLQLDLQRPWRMVGVSHSQNELLVDVIETIDVTVSQSGRLEFCHIRGQVEVTSHLSETPICKLILASNSRWEDVTLHRCVELESTDTKTIPFVPPDGLFCLLKYRITATQSNIPLFIVPKFQWARGGVSFDLTVRPDGALPKGFEGLDLRFELPEGVHQPALTLSEGQARWEIGTKEVVWLIGNYGKKESVQLKGNATMDSGFELGGRFPVIRAKFTTIGSLPSNFKIDRVDIENVSYKSFKGVKYLVRSGNYEFRTGLN